MAYQLVHVADLLQSRVKLLDDFDTVTARGGSVEVVVTRPQLVQGVVVTIDLQSHLVGLFSKMKKMGKWQQMLT